MEMNNNNAANAAEDIMTFDTDFAPIVEQDFDADVQEALDAIDTELDEADFLAEAFQSAEFPGWPTATEERNARAAWNASR